MRVAILTDGYPTEEDFSAGVGTYFHSIARGLQDLGHSVEVFAPSRVKGDAVFERIRVHRVCIPFDFIERVEKVLRYRFNCSLRYIWQSCRLRSAFSHRHREEPFDIVQTTSSKGTGLALSFGRPVPISSFAAYHPRLCREADETTPSLDQRISEWLQIHSLRRSDGAYAPSQLYVHAFNEQDGCQLERLFMPFVAEVQPENDRFLRTEIGNRPYALFFGQVSRLKGVDLLADAIASTLHGEHEFRLILIGRDIPRQDGSPMMDVVLKRTAGMNVEITHYAHLRHEQLYPVIANARVVVLPSRVDNIPNTMLEAMHFGRVVVGARGASFEDLIEDGRNGFLFPVGDATGLASCLSRAWRLPDAERKAIGAAAQETLKRLTPQAILPQLLDHYTRLIGPR